MEKNIVPAGELREIKKKTQKKFALAIITEMKLKKMDTVFADYLQNNF